VALLDQLLPLALEYLEHQSILEKVEKVGEIQDLKMLNKLEVLSVVVKRIIVKDEMAVKVQVKIVLLHLNSDLSIFQHFLLPLQLKLKQDILESSENTHVKLWLQLFTD